MRRRTYALPGALSLLCAIAGGLQEASVCGQTLSQSSSAESLGELLYQEVVVAQRSVLGVQGISSQLDLGYCVLSSLTIHEHTNGVLDVEQKIEAARLLQADEATRALFKNLLQKLTGTTFTMTFSPERELVRFEGAKDTARAAGGGQEVGQTVLLASLIDRDGWKELARYSFFQPQRPLRHGTFWKKGMTHNWGLLGIWTGQVSFHYAGQQGGLQRFPYAFNLTYVPPKAEARDPLFPVSGASFKHGPSGGTIYFDADKRRVSHVAEQFRVKGQMSIEVLGQKVPVDLDEEQRFEIRLLEQDPRSGQSSSTKESPWTSSTDR